MNKVSWKEQATLVRLNAGPITDGGREIVAESTLAEVVGKLEALSMVERRRYLIALPDRGAPPFRFDADDLERLLGRPDRPGAIGFPPPARGRDRGPRAARAPGG